MNVAIWLTTLLVFDAPFAVLSLWIWKRRRRRRALRARIAPYSHLGG